MQWYYFHKQTILFHKPSVCDYNLGPVHTYPDIFESATFSFRIRKFPRQHVAYSNRIRPSTHI